MIQGISFGIQVRESYSVKIYTTERELTLKIGASHFGRNLIHGTIRSIIKEKILS